MGPSPSVHTSWRRQRQCSRPSATRPSRRSTRGGSRRCSASPRRMWRVHYAPRLPRDSLKLPRWQLPLNGRRAQPKRPRRTDVPGADAANDAPLRLLRSFGGCRCPAICTGFSAPPDVPQQHRDRKSAICWRHSCESAKRSETRRPFRATKCAREGIDVAVLESEARHHHHRGGGWTGHRYAGRQSRLRGRARTRQQ